MSEMSMYNRKVYLHVTSTSSIRRQQVHLLMGLAVDQLDEGQAAQLRPVDAVLQQLQHQLPRRAGALLALLGLCRRLRACTTWF